MTQDGTSVESIVAGQQHITVDDVLYVINRDPFEGMFSVISKAGASNRLRLAVSNGLVSITLIEIEDEIRLEGEEAWHDITVPKMLLDQEITWLATARQLKH